MTTKELIHITTVKEILKGSKDLNETYRRLQILDTLEKRKEQNNGQKR